MIRIARRVACSAVAALALVGGFVLTSDAKTGLVDGEPAKTSNLMITVSEITQPYEGHYLFKVLACGLEETSSTGTIKRTDFTLRAKDGSSSPAGLDSELTGDLPFPASSTVKPGHCVEGLLSGKARSGLASVSYLDGQHTWVESIADGPDSVNVGQTAMTQQGLSVTVGTPVALGKDAYRFSLRVCSTRATTIGWNDVQVIDGDGTKRTIGGSEDVLTENAFPDTVSLAAGDCKEGDLLIHSPGGIKHIQVRGLIFTNTKPGQLPKTGD